MVVRPNQIVKTAWIDIDKCVSGNREPMAPAAVEKAYNELLQLNSCQLWPPISGYWHENGSQFVVCDGRHEWLALVMLGREKAFVAWLDEKGGT